MMDGYSRQIPKPSRKGARWTSFVGGFVQGRRVRALAEESNPLHKVRVEHNRDTLLVHISNEDGDGWTTVAIDRSTREWSVAQRRRQLDAASAACSNLYSAS